MDSKVFQDEFIPTENEEAILAMQYVIVSTRIRLRHRNKCKNCVIANALYPDSSVFARLTPEDLKDAYFEQLEDNLPLLATLIQGAIKKEYNITFICSRKELKSAKYLKYLAEFILLKFEYPIYNYSGYINEEYKDFVIDEKKILKKCNKILKDAEEKNFRSNLKTANGREVNLKNYAKRSKSSLKKELKERNLYTPDMTKADMLEMIQLFMV